MFEKLRPPAGGLVALRTRIEARERRLRLWLVTGAMLVPVCVSLLVWLAPEPAFADRQTPALLSLTEYRLPLEEVAALPGSTTSVHRVAVEGDVVFYWVSASR